MCCTNYLKMMKIQCPSSYPTNSEKTRIHVLCMHQHLMACTQELIRVRFNLHIYFIIQFYKKVKLDSSYTYSYLLSRLHSLFINFVKIDKILMVCCSSTSRCSHPKPKQIGCVLMCFCNY